MTFHGWTTTARENKQIFFFKMAQHQISSDDLRILAEQFIINSPKYHSFDANEMFINIQDAFWHYIDTMCPEAKSKKFTVPIFATQLLQSLSQHRKFIPNIEATYRQFKRFEKSIPTYGAIMIAPDEKHVLLVESLKSGKWCFPKGKQNKGEAEEDCARREVRVFFLLNCIVFTSFFF